MLIDGGVLVPEMTGGVIKLWQLYSSTVSDKTEKSYVFVNPFGALCQRFPPRQGYL
jgi:hypothetical protein